MNPVKTLQAALYRLINMCEFFSKRQEQVNDDLYTILTYRLFDGARASQDLTLKPNLLPNSSQTSSQTSGLSAQPLHLLSFSVHERVFAVSSSTVLQLSCSFLRCLRDASASAASYSA